MNVRVKVTIALKEGMLDPEARAIQQALANLGFGTERLSSARLFYITLEASSTKEAEQKVRQMCERLLANPVIHRYAIEVEG
ncbi:MAG: phosphoribosylformylglycinamidine synthase subunit PurS [Methanomicrobiales archaeon]|nr:phosphoribosylformylglycinamidine synthase subunit PurS [Methanomicrobiales archaeon]